MKQNINNNDIKRYFNINLKLPQELQTNIALKTYQSNKSIITGSQFEDEILNILLEFQEDDIINE